LGIQKGYVVVLFILVVTGLALDTAITVLDFSSGLDRDKAFDLVEPRKGIWTTYHTLSVLGILIASATISKSVFGGAGFSRPKVSHFIPIYPFLASTTTLAHSQY
jgi:hypothetical protein